MVLKNRDRNSDEITLVAFIVELSKWTWKVNADSGK